MPSPPDASALRGHIGRAGRSLSAACEATMKAAGIARERPPAPAALKGAESAGVLNRPVRIGRKKARPLALRLVAFRKRPASWARAQREGNILGGKAAAAEWLIPVTHPPRRENLPQP